MTVRRGIRFYALWITLSALTGSWPGLLWAESTAAGSFPGDAAWNDPGNPICKQGCTYDKANETTTILVQYLENKLSGIQEAKANGEDDKALAAMGDFCFPNETVSPCFERWEQFTLLEISKARRSIIQNENSHAKLMSKRVDRLTGKVEGNDVPAMPLSSGPKDGLRKPIVSYFPGYDEMEADYKKNSLRNRQLVSGQFAQWLAEYPTAPSKEDFVKTRQILRDPKNPAAGVFTVVDMDGAKAKYDEKAFALADKSYKEAIKNLTTSTGTPPEDPVLRYKKEYSKKPPLPKLTFKEAVDPISKKALIEARSYFVDQANHEMSRRGALGIGAGVNSPAPAAAQNAKNQTANAGNVAAAASNPSPTTAAQGRSVSSVSNVNSPSNPLGQKAAPSATVATGNEQVKPPVATKENQFNTDSVIMDTKDLGRVMLKQMQHDVGGIPLPAVELPPAD